MNKKLRAFLEANGLRKDASEQDAWELYDKLVADGVELPGVDPGKRSAAGKKKVADPADQDDDGQRADPPVKPEPPVDVNAAVARALAEDASRRAEIEDRLRIAGLADDADFSRSLVNNPAVSLERASREIFKKLQERNIPIGNGAVSGAHVGVDSRDKLRTVITDGLMLRCGHRLEKPAEGSREFRGRTLSEICRELLESAGVNTRGMDNRQIASRALASGSTSDLPYIFGSLVNKNLLAAYAEAPQTFRPFVSVGSANDFKLMYAIKLSGAPDLETVNENGEYKTASLSDSGESYRVVRKGIKIPFTFEMIINDDMRALSRAPQLFGLAARRMEGDAVYSLITTNGNLSDGYALFSSDHSNLAGTAGVPASDTLSVARTAMRKQTGMGGETIDVQPAFFVGPTAYETSMDILLRSASLPTTEMSSGVVNPWTGKLTPITEPRLDAASADAWYLFAHPNVAPVIEVAWLMGEEAPYVDEQIDFNSDAMILKVRHVFGAGVVDYVGGYKNAGE